MKNDAIRDPSQNRALVQEQAKHYLRKSGAKLTRHRLELLEEIFSSREYFTAEDLLARLRLKGVRVSLATIYRFVNELQKGRFLRAVEDGSESRKFDPNYPTSPSHYHILCKDCGKLVEFEDPCLDLRERAVAMRHGFLAEELVVRVDATCERHQKSKDCPNNQPPEAKPAL